MIEMIKNEYVEFTPAPENMYAVYGDEIGQSVQDNDIYSKIVMVAKNVHGEFEFLEDEDMGYLADPSSSPISQAYYFKDEENIRLRRIEFIKEEDLRERLNLIEEKIFGGK